MMFSMATDEFRIRIYVDLLMMFVFFCVSHIMFVIFCDDGDDGDDNRGGGMMIVPVVFLEGM